MIDLVSLEKILSCPHVNRGDGYGCGKCGLIGNWPRDGEDLEHWATRRRAIAQIELEAEIAQVRRNYKL